MNFEYLQILTFHPTVRMRSVLYLALLYLAESFPHQKQGLWHEWMSGKELVYDYKDFICSGLPATTKQYSVLKLKAKLFVYPLNQTTIVMQLREIMLGKASNTEITRLNYEDVPVQYFHSPKYQQVLSKPMAFSQHRGRITGCYFEQSDKVWSTNIKRSIIERFQIQIRRLTLNPEDGFRSNSQSLDTFRTEEDGIGGLCYNTYDILSAESFFYPYSQRVLNITKTRDFKKCKYRPAFEHNNFDSRGCPWTCRGQPWISTFGKTGHSHTEFDEVKGGCPCGFESYQTPVKSYAVTKYNVSLNGPALVIDSIINEGKTSLYVQGNLILVLSRNNVTLKRIRQIQTTTIPIIQNPVRFKKLSYEIPLNIFHPRIKPAFQDQPYLSAFLGAVGPIKTDDMISISETLLRRITRDIMAGNIEAGKFIGENVLKLAKTMSALDTASLENLRRKIMFQNIQAPQEEIDLMRKFFLNTLPLCGTNEAVQYIMRLLESGDIENNEAREMIEAVPKNIVFPNVATIKSLKEFCLDIPKVRDSKVLFGSVCLAFGKLVHKACVEPYTKTRDRLPVPDELREQYEIYKSYMNGKEREGLLPEQLLPYKRETCTTKHAIYYIEEIEKRLKKANKFYEKTTYIETIAHISHKFSFNVLEPYITGKANNFCQNIYDRSSACNMLRSVTVCTLRHLVGIYPEEVRGLINPIYFNKVEPYELRIACFGVMLFSDPPLPVLEKVARESWTETSKEVGSFVYSALNEFANGTHPCTKSVADRIRLVMPKMKEFRLGYFYSKFWLKDFYDDSILSGMQSYIAYTSNKINVFPRILHLSFAHNWASFYNMPFELSANVKGIEDLVYSTGFSFEDIFDGLKFCKTLKQSFLHFVHNINGKVKFTKRKAEKFKAAILFKLFERSTYFSLDKQSALELVQEFTKILDRLKTTPSHFVKILMPNSIFKLVPSEIGLPVVVASTNPIVISLKLGRLGTNVTTTAHPAIYFTSAILATVVTTPDKMSYGASIYKTYNLGLPVTFSASFVESRVKVKPKMSYQIFHHKTVSGTFATKFWLFDPDKSMYDGLITTKELPKPIKYETYLTSKILGIGLKIKAVTDNHWDRILFWRKNILGKLGFIPALLKFISNPQWSYRDYQLWIEQDPPNVTHEYTFYSKYKRNVLMAAPQPSLFKGSQNWSRMHFDPKELIDREQPNSSESRESIEDRLPLNKQLPEREIFQDTRRNPVSVWYKITAGLDSTGSRHLPLMIEAVYVRTIDYRILDAQVIILLKSFTNETRPWKFFSTLRMEFPPIPSDFTFDSNREEMKASLKGTISWGPKISNRMSNIVISGTLDKIDYSVFIPERSEEFPNRQPWYEERCQVDTIEGRSRSYSCKLAIKENSFFDRVALDIEYTELSPYFVNFTKRIDLTMKEYLYPNIESNSYFAQRPANSLRVVLKFLLVKPDKRLLSISLFKPNEDIFYENMYFPYLMPISSLLKYKDIYLDKIFAYRDITECSILENYIVTFDNVTISYPQDDCEYIVSKDCSELETYTVLAKQIHKTKIITIEVAHHTIKILPPKSLLYAELVIDGKVHHISEKKALIFNEILIYMLIHPNFLPSTIIVDIPKIGIKVKSDGQNAVIEVSPIYIGRHCGICGNYDRESYLEYVGPEECIYKKSEDFVKKYAEKDASCDISPRGQFVCPNRLFAGQGSLANIWMQERLRAKEEIEVSMCSMCYPDKQDSCKE